MQCSIKKNNLIILFILFLSTNYLNAENLYECNFNNKLATYHENDAKRMILLGADCRIMNSAEHISCSMNGVRVNYSKREAEEILYKYPNAYCEINSMLFLSNYNQSSKSEPLVLDSKLIIHFNISSKKLSTTAKNKILRFAKLHRNMGYIYNITGYASATGTSEKNHLLSLKRAATVRNALLNGGINENNILSVDALGEESLRYNTKYETVLNRTVAIKAFKR